MKPKIKAQYLSKAQEHTSESRATETGWAAYGETTRLSCIGGRMLSILREKDRNHDKRHFQKKPNEEIKQFIFKSPMDQKINTMGIRKMLLSN